LSPRVTRVPVRLLIVVAGKIPAKKADKRPQRAAAVTYERNMKTSPPQTLTSSNIDRLKHKPGRRENRPVNKSL
jgi:hypothetical protein